MFKSKQGQLTAFVIIGLLLVGLSAILLFNTTSPQITKTKVQAEQIIKQLQKRPLVDYITLCLEEETKNAVKLLGLNGGYFNSQNYLNSASGQFRVHYGLTEFSSENYPFDDETYTHGKNTAFEKGGIGHKRYPFGKLDLPFLCQIGGPNDVDAFVYANPCPAGSYGENSMQEHLTRYIRQRLVTCINGPNQDRIKEVIGLTVTAEEPKVGIMVGEEDLTVTASYPLVIEGKEQETHLADFSKRLPVRLKRVYGFVHDLLKADRLLLDFNVSKRDYYERSSYADPALSVQVSTPQKGTNTPEQFDDMITIVDAESRIDGKPFLFNTARINRKPALVSLNESKTVQGFEADYIAVVGDTFTLDIIAFDPDEDELTFTLTGWGFDDTGKRIKDDEDPCPKQTEFYQAEDKGQDYLIDNCMTIDQEFVGFWDSATDEDYPTSYQQRTHLVSEDDFGYHTINVKVCDPTPLCDSQNVRILVVESNDMIE